MSAELSFDVIVAGGGPGGFGAAIGAARAGVRVAVIERHPILGVHADGRRFAFDTFNLTNYGKTGQQIFSAGRSTLTVR
jgi:2-polyprenyl-6-methoxyphenol hydroxylase-like FAD-dependent oxidoreductase